MTEEVAQLLRELHASGQTGLGILIAILVLLVAVGLWMFFFQRRFIALALDAQKIIDSKVQAADSLREESRKSQEYSAADIGARITALTAINDELRKEIERLAQQQKNLSESQAAFRQSVKDSITVGLQDIKERMASVTVTEMLDQIPASFRDDLQNSLVEASKKVILETTETLKRAPSELIDLDAISKELEWRLRRAMEEFPIPWPDPRDWRYREHYEYSERYIDEFARRVAYHLRRHL